MNEREAFWKGEFGDDYNRRSPGNEDANYHLFKRILIGHSVNSAIELGAGTGANLRALHRLRPAAELTAVEINRDACEALLAQPMVAHGVLQVVNASLLDLMPERSWDLAFTKGVLIHVHPDDLPIAYSALWNASNRYILVAEYYNPKPAEVPYRGHAGRLWKRDFAGEMLDRFPLDLIDYGFVYHRDAHPQDDLTWFLMEKKS